MIPLPSLTQIVRCHNSWQGFDYQLAIDWAIEQIRKGTETDNILIVAACSASDSRYEISPHVSAALRDLNLSEYDEASAMRLRIQNHVVHILNETDIRNHLYSLYRIAMETGVRKDVRAFYFLYHGWNELDASGADLYYGTKKETVVADVKKEAEIWFRDYSINE